MFKRDTIRVPAPPEDFTHTHGTRARDNPWAKITEQSQRLEKLTERNEKLTERNEQLADQVRELYRQQLLDYLGSKGIHTKNDETYLRVLPTFHEDGANYVTLPKGWSWEHCIERGLARFYPESREARPLSGDTSTLILRAPNGERISAISSTILQLGRDQPFNRGQINYACRRVIEKLLPTPRDEQPAPIGVFWEDA